MIKSLQNLKFNMTDEMAEHLNNFFNLKLKLELLKKEALENSSEFIFDEKEIIKQIEQSRNNFIKEFRKNNQIEIKEYINLTTEK